MVKIDFVNAQEPAINDTNLNQMQLNIENAINAQVSGDTLPVACIVPFTSDTVPENWLLCDGQAVSRTDYALLFNIIGTAYGVGDGSTTFNLPNLKGRIAVGKDSTQTEFDNLGETGGEKAHTLTVEEMPSHNHMQSTNYGRMTNMLEIDSNYGFAQSGAYKDRTVAATSATTNVYGTSNTGGGQPHNILQPYQVTNYIIKARQSSGIIATVVDGLNSTSTTDALSANQGKVLNEKMFPMEILANNYNIDNIKQSGFYGIFNATGTLPTGYSTSDNNIFIESIMWSSDYGRQILHDVRSESTYIRNLSADSWHSWTQIF